MTEAEPQSLLVDRNCMLDFVTASQIFPAGVVVSAA
jgi:hypothetical protein